MVLVRTCTVQDEKFLLFSVFFQKKLYIYILLCDMVRNKGRTNTDTNHFFFRITHRYASVEE